MCREGFLSLEAKLDASTGALATASGGLVPASFECVCIWFRGGARQVGKRGWTALLPGDTVRRPLWGVISLTSDSRGGRGIAHQGWEFSESFQNQGVPLLCFAPFWGSLLFLSSLVERTLPPPHPPKSKAKGKEIITEKMYPN